MPLTNSSVNHLTLTCEFLGSTKNDSKQKCCLSMGKGTDLQESALSESEVANARLRNERLIAVC